MVWRSAEEIWIYAWEMWVIFYIDVFTFQHSDSFSCGKSQPVFFTLKTKESLSCVFGKETEDAHYETLMCLKCLLFTHMLILCTENISTNPTALMSDQHFYRCHLLLNVCFYCFDIVYTFIYILYFALELLLIFSFNS